MIWHVVSVLILIAIFGVVMANFALRHEKKLGEKLAAPKLSTDPFAWIWWQDLTSLKPGARRTIEIHLTEGTAWHTNDEGIVWYNRPHSATCVACRLSGKSKLKDALGSYLQQIDQNTDVAKSKHAHVLTEWSSVDKAYLLTLLNGSTWQFNTKSEGLGKDNELAWHLIKSDSGTVFEALVKVYADLNKHLVWIRQQQAREEFVGRGLQNAAAVAHESARAVNVCGGCHFRTVSIPGGICRACRSAQGA